MTLRRQFVWSLFSVFLSSLVAQSQAHEVRPAIADVQFLSDGLVQIAIEANLEALIAGISPQHKNTDDAPNARQYDRLRSLSSARLEDEYLAGFVSRFTEGVSLSFDGNRIDLFDQGMAIPEVEDMRRARISTLYLRGTIPRNAQNVTLSYAADFGNMAIKFRHNDEQAQSVHWVVDGQSSPVFSLSSKVVPQAWSQVAWNYIKLGFEHIVPKGLDHILFVLGLFLLSTKAGPLLTQITSFTVAHSITLGLSIYGLVALPSFIVEPLIAISIVYVGLENIMRGENNRFRLIVVFVFGLLHGLGFAGVLTEIGLPRADFLTALVAFNVGVELGQISVILIAFLVVILLRLKGHPRYRQRVIIPGSVLISIVGFYWFLERVEFI